MAKRLTIRHIVRKKAAGEKIAMVTAYDATFARLLDEAGADMILVGDSLGMVVQGHDTTLPVTVEHMLYHTQAVVRGSQQALVVADMPFMSYQASVEEGLRNAGRLLAEGGAQAVKVEGGQRCVPIVNAMVDAGIPAMGHLGLTPQSVNVFGGFRVQGREEEAAERLVADALALQEAGAFGLVLEMMPAALAAQVTEALDIPTIGIGAGAGCDGQVLVCYDYLGMDERFTPRFVRRYRELAGDIRAATAEYVADVRSGAFPTKDHSFE